MYNGGLIQKGSKWGVRFCAISNDSGAISFTLNKGQSDCKLGEGCLILVGMHL